MHPSGKSCKLSFVVQENTSSRKSIQDVAECEEEIEIQQ